jgi:hypothetical protein
MSPVERVLDEEIERSAAPVLVRDALGRLGEYTPDLADRLAEDRLRRAVIAVIAASRSLTRLIEHHPDETLGILARLDGRPALEARTPETLAHWKQL